MRWVPGKCLRAIFRLLVSGGEGVETDPRVTPCANIAFIRSIVELSCAPRVDTFGQFLSRAVLFLFLLVVVVLVLVV